MNTLRTLSLTLAAIAALSLAFGTVGFTSASLERGVSVDVVSDDQAFIGYETTAKSGVSEGDTIELVEIENRLGQEITVDEVQVSTSEGGFSVEQTSTPGGIGVGENGTVTGEVETCEDDPTVQVTVSVSGTGVYATIFGDTATREFEVECASNPTITGVTFVGNGQVKIHADNVDAVNVTYLATEVSNSEGSGTSASPTKGTIDGSVPTNEKLSRNNDFGVSGEKKLVALRIENEAAGIDVTYVRSTYDIEEEILPNASKRDGWETDGIDWSSYE